MKVVSKFTLGVFDNIGNKSIIAQTIQTIALLQVLITSKIFNAFIMVYK